MSEITGENRITNLIERINKLSLPATILIASFILGGFYYLSQISKQNSIERQQQVELRAKEASEQTERDREASDKLGKVFCVSEAEQQAVKLNKESCERGEYCIRGEGMYLVDQYENAYKTCLQRKGLE